MILNVEEVYKALLYNNVDVKGVFHVGIFNYDYTNDMKYNQNLYLYLKLLN